MHRMFHSPTPRAARSQSPAARLVTATVVMALVIAAVGTAFGQMQVSRGGHALDANLKLGSGGYNRPARASSVVSRSRYTHGSSRSLYTVNSRGQMRYNPNNAFTPRSRYRATGYTGDYSSRSYHSRFRYQNSGYR
jgi:hypothetical protein